MPEYSVFNIPENLLENANEVVREDAEVFTVLSDKEGKSHYKYVVTVLNESSKAEHLTFHYSNQRKVSNISIRIYDALGKLVQKVKKSALVDYSTFDGFSVYQDERFKYYKANYHSFPFTIEYSYDKTETGMYYAFFPHWNVFSGFNSAVEKSTFVIKLPKGKRLHYQELNTAVQVKKTIENKYDVYSWEFSNLPALISEPNMPSSSKVFPMVMTAADKFKIDKYEGGMGSWEAFSSFMEKLYDGRGELPSELAEKVNALAAEAETDIEKIKILYRFMQQNMRYVSVQLGLGGWQPFDVEYVYRNKYGDCKALTNYMYAMLTEVGVEAQPALVYRGDLHYEVTEDFTYSPFNHVVLYIPSENYWLECTSTDYPPNYLGSSNANRKALLIRKKGGHLIKTPELGFKENVQSGKAVIHLNTDGSATIDYKVISTGTKHEPYRYFENEYSEKEIKEWVEKNTSIPSVSFKNIKIATEKDTPKSAFSYEAESRRLGSKAGKRIFIPLNVINRFQKIPPKKESRIYPIVLSDGYIETDTILLYLPEDYKIESIPEENITFESEFASYNMTVKKREDRLIIKRKLEIHRAELPAEQYNDYRNFFKKVAKTDNLKAVFVKKVIRP